MTDDAERWKEKYLKSAEEQEKLERRWNARLDLLRRGLVRSTLAAEGSDKAVDACMKEMREVVRTDNMDGALATLIPRLEKAVLDSEQRREARVSQISTALSALVSQLQALPLPRDASKPLKKFASSLEKRATQSRELPLLLSELSNLQGSALAALEPSEQPTRQAGLFERLFGGKAEEPETEPHPAPTAPTPAPTPAARAAEPEKAADPAAAPAPPPAPESAIEPETPAAVAVPKAVTEPAPRPATPEPEPEPEPTVQTAAAPPASVPADTEPAPRALSPVLLDTLPLPSLMAQALAAVDPEQPEEEVLYALPESPEPSYSSVAGHIESTLLGMLDDLSLPEKLQPLATSMRKRLSSGLNWYELLPLLDDVVVLVLGISDHGQLELQRYLLLLDERFEHFLGQLHAASDGHAQNQGAAQELDESLREQVGQLRESVSQAENPDAIGRLLEHRFDNLIGTLDQHRKQREQRDQEVAERLQGLAARVASMEEEAQHYRENLEVQRKKALLDPLTGLPNRAAWGERLEQAIEQRDHNDAALQVAIFDLDHFKAINDGYGHLAGDKVLKIVATVLSRKLRGGDFLARFGGEEFVLLMPATRASEAQPVLNELRQAIEACPFHFKGVRVTITVSIGSTAFRAKEAGEPALKRADQALYRAKASGRNRIEMG